MNRIGVVLLLAVAVGIGAFMLGALTATHAVQSPTITTRSPSVVSSGPAPSSGSTSNPLSSANFPPSLFSGVPCHRCIMAHVRFWS